jgi:hypothetical protein
MKIGTVVGALWRNVGFICAGIVFVYCLDHAFDPPRLNWGDSGSDYNVMAAGKNFQDHGFLALRLTPNLLDRAVWTPEDTIMRYTHYPQLPDLANGAYRVIFGMTDLVQFRFIAIAFSFAAFFFIYRLIAMYWTRQTAQVAIALWLINPLWIQHADYLHNGPYASFFGAGCLYFLVRALRDGPRWRYLAVSGLFLFLTYCSSYDHWVFVPLLLALATVHHYRGVAQREVFETLGFLACFALLAIAGKAATNIWALGGLEPFLKDLHYQGLEHSTDEIVRTSFMDGVWPTLFGRIERYFTLLLLPMALAWAGLPWARRRWSDRIPSLGALTNPLPLLLAAIPFLAVFRELWIAQYYPFLMVLPFYAIGFAVLVVLLVEMRAGVAKAAGIILLVGVAANGIEEHARFDRAFFDRDAIRTLGRQIDSLSPPGQRVLTNHNFDASYRYYFRRKIFAMILAEPYRVQSQLVFLSDPRRSPFVYPQQMLFVQHKRLTAELHDKGYYNVLEHYRLWEAWGNPPRYRRFLDSLFADRDSLLMARIAEDADKLYESEFYTLWRMKPLVVRALPVQAPRAPGVR